jgi:hypothetical protein
MFEFDGGGGDGVVLLFSSSLVSDVSTYTPSSHFLSLQTHSPPPTHTHTHTLHTRSQGHRSLTLSELKKFCALCGSDEETSSHIIKLLGSKDRHGERIAFAEVAWLLQLRSKA